ncbi:MAG: hypothetical protein ACPG6V_01090 [Flavobacteriales bacterium]
MKKMIFILPLLICLQGFAQNFEGVISYRSTYTSNMDGVTVEEMFGQKSSLDQTSIKDGFYLNKSTTGFMNYQLWRSIDTMEYFMNTSSKDTVWFNKTNSLPTHFDSTAFEANADTVAGYLCNKLTVFRGNQIYSYYYHPDFTLDPKYYNQYLNIAKFEILKLMKSPYLKLTISSPKFGLDMEAVNIKIKHLPDSIFRIPEGPLVEFRY